MLVLFADIVFTLSLKRELKYAQVVKTRVNGVLEKVEKKTIFGKDIEQKEISTTLLERQNLILGRITTEFQGKR